MTKRTYGRGLGLLALCALAALAFAPALDGLVVDAQLLAGVVGALLSLAFAYVPNVQEWYDARTAKEKAGIMALGLIAVSVAIFALGCTQIVSVTLACSPQGVVELVRILLAALMANQSTYLLAVRQFKP